MKLQRLTRMALALGFLTLIGWVLAAMALSDISHHTEPDLSMEWAVVRLSFFLTLFFLGISMPTLFQWLRNKP